MDAGNPVITPLRIDPRQRYFTTVQPFSYRDTLTVLYYVQDIAANVDTLREQLDNLAKDEEADVNEIKQLVAGFNDQFKRLNKAMDDLEKKVGQYEDSDLVYNPTRGQYEDSRHVTRDLYRELAVFGARVNQMAQLDAATASAYTTLEFAVVGNKTIFHDNEPRITPRDRHVEAYDPDRRFTVKRLAESIVDERGYVKAGTGRESS